ncbi:MAG: hypothetical protein GF355_03120 [Candidatus Eisenbacteria bacterium]|nr:hypothetical protein [Candidatus Eisenbacteria bacterium]
MPRTSSLFLMTAIAVLLIFFSRPDAVHPQEEDSLFDRDTLQSRVQEIYQENCTTVGCHSGADAQQGMDLTPEAFYGSTVNQPSQGRPEILRVHPGKPDSSYVLMKLRGAPDIEGERMPFGRQPLPQREITIIVAWIQSLEGVEEPPASRPPATGQPFAAWSAVNSPTTRMLDSGLWLFFIGHRFFPRVNSGYETLYGIDGSAAILLKLGYAVTNDVLVALGRSNLTDTVELETRYRFKQQGAHDPLPFSLASRLAVDWLTQDGVPESQRFKFSGQLIASSLLYDGYAVNIAPGILYNPNTSVEDEDPLVSMGLGAEVHVWNTISLIGEWVPILDGYQLTSTLGAFNRFDSWAGAVQIDVGGHIFQIVATNSLGLTANQYMQGGDLDIGEGDLRLGFNIYRILDF